MSMTRSIINRFWQPGRVVTLIPAEKDKRVFGMAYEIEDTVMSHLDFREKNGYERFNVQFFPLEDHQDKATQHSDPFDLTVYVATESNVSFAGPKAIPELAKQVIEATGPSGRNRDYVYNLADAIRELFPGEDDPHLFALEAEVKRLEKEAEAKGVRSI